LRPDPYQSTVLVTTADRRGALSTRHAIAVVAPDDSDPTSE